MFLTGNSSVDPVIRSAIELQAVVDKLPEEREHGKEGSEANGVDAQERILENMSKRDPISTRGMEGQ